MTSAPRSSRLDRALFVVLFAGGCATVATGKYGSALDAQGHVLAGGTTPLGLRVSSQEVREQSSANFGLVAITFENPTAHWVRLRSMLVRFATAAQNQAVLIPWGEDIATWQRAAGLREEIRRTNTRLVLAGVALGAGAVAGFARSDAVALTGGAIAAGALTALAVDDAEEGLSRLQRPAPFPETHVMAVPFAVPPGLFSRRWLLLNAPDSAGVGCITALLLEYETDAGERERVWLRFRSMENRSEWQARTCRRLAREQGRAKH